MGDGEGAGDGRGGGGGAQDGADECRRWGTWPRPGEGTANDLAVLATGMVTGGDCGVSEDAADERVVEDGVDAMVSAAPALPPFPRLPRRHR
jgi:hypothetical protein